MITAPYVEDRAAAAAAKNGDGPQVIYHPQSPVASRNPEPRDETDWQGGVVGQVYVCQPCYGLGVPASLRQFYTCRSRTAKAVTRVEGGGSLLANSFNQFWCHALNLQEGGAPVTHFAMLHSDVIPQDNWLDILLEELGRVQKDDPAVGILSAVVPIKDWMGLTSTAIEGKDRFTPLRRITMTEVFNLPETFSGSDCGYRDEDLLVNTGCWVADLTQPWVRAEDEHGCLKVFFTIHDRIRVVKGEKCKVYHADVAPEDWNFSRFAAAAGCRTRATRKVRLTHQGTLPFNNSEPWGTCEHDRLLSNRHGGNMIIKPGCEFRNRTVDVPGWLSEEEGEALAKLAAGKQVLEIGSYCGKSTIWMARVAEQVYAVDTFDGRGTAEPRDTLTEFKRNLDKYNVLGQVRIFQGLSQHMADQIYETFDLAFIDGGHDAESVRADIAVAQAKLRPAGVMAFHDYGRPEDFAVTAAVNDLLAEGWENIGQWDSVIALRRPQAERAALEAEAADRPTSDPDVDADDDCPDTVCEDPVSADGNYED